MTDKLNQIIAAEIKKRSQSYTPEWHFDTEHMDIGSALALVYARMLAGSVKRFERIPMKNRVAFLNELGACIQPAVPAHGYASFRLINEEAEPAGVPAGTEVMASDSSLPGGQVNFATREDVLVTPAEMTDVYQTCDRHDEIYRFYDRRAGMWKPFCLFGTGGDNLQKHELYFSQDIVMHIETETFIELVMFSHDNVTIGEDWLSVLADRNCFVFSYYSDVGWTEFHDVEMYKQGIRFHKAEDQPAFARLEMGGYTGYWMRLRVVDYKAAGEFHLQKIRMASWSTKMLPDTVYGAQEECDVHRYFPFGERLELYRDVYFGSGEVLSKKGADITLGFGIRFVKIPLESNTESSLNWEWVMKRSDFKVDTEFDVTIEGVIWEYYNGSGWTRLFADDTCSRCFSVNGGKYEQYRTLHFICPPDIEPVLVNAVETYYIRARIMKINNLYKLSGHYIVPMLENTSFQYRYKENHMMAERFVICNNLETAVFDAAQLTAQGVSRPFVQTGVRDMAVYLGFEVMPSGSPLKMLLCIMNEADRSRHPVYWEYWNGKCWKELNVVDETEHLSRTGLVTFMGNADLACLRLFGKERYWLRLRDAEGVYADDGLDRNMRPVWEGLWMNTVRVRNIYHRRREFFQIEMYQENKCFVLPDRDIYEAQVFVDEQGHLSEEEQAQMIRQKKAMTERDGDGNISRIWVEWERVEDFVRSGAGDRHFVLDEADGKLTFGNGHHGKVPYTSGSENVQICYSCGGGAYTNIPGGMIDRMGVSIGYISEVTNPEAMIGGCDRETLEEAIDRTSAAIRHQNRAVCARDFEELAVSAVRELRMAKCFAGYDAFGNPESGAVTLVVLPEQYRQGQIYFVKLREQLLDALSRKIGIALLNSGRFSVVMPELIEVRLYIELLVESFDRVFEIKKEIMERLRYFLAPAGRDRRDGWQIGSFPDTMQIRNEISSITGIVSLTNIMMSAYTAGAGQQKEVDVETVRRHRYVLPVDGKHEVMIGVV